MMACWQRLGLAPTNDERAIKRAYAKILKTIDQDAEPERFIVLREAMQQALDQARYVDWDETEDDAAEDLGLVAPISEPVAMMFDDTASATTDTDSPDPITIPLSMSSTLTTAEPIDQQKTQFDPAFNQHTIWHEWQPDQQQVEKFKRDVDQLRQRFWAGQYDDTSYRAFVDVLRRLPEQPLALQMEVQEQLSGVLAQSPEQPDTERFIQICIEQLDWQDDVVGRDAASIQLQQRFAVLNAKKQFWQMVPTAYFQDLQVLADGSRLAWRSMWHLSGSKDPKILALKQANWQTIPYRDPDLQRNLALQLLLRIRMIYDYRMAILLFCLINAIFIWSVFDTSVLLAAIISLALGCIWHNIFLAPFYAWMKVKSQDNYLWYFRVFFLWFVLGVFLLITSMLWLESLFVFLVWIWAVITVFWIAETNQSGLTPSLVNCILQISTDYIERCLISVMFFSFFILIVSCLEEFLDGFRDGFSIAIIVSFSLLFFILVGFREYAVRYLKYAALSVESVWLKIYSQLMEYSRRFVDRFGLLGMFMLILPPIAALMFLFNCSWEIGGLISGLRTFGIFTVLTVVAMIPASNTLAFFAQHLSYLVFIMLLYMAWAEVLHKTSNSVIVTLFMALAGMVGWYWYRRFKVDY